MEFKSAITRNILENNFRNNTIQTFFRLTVPINLRKSTDSINDGRKKNYVHYEQPEIKIR